MLDIFKLGYVLFFVLLALNLLVGYKNRILFSNLRIGIGLFVKGEYNRFRYIIKVFFSVILDLG